MLCGNGYPDNWEAHVITYRTHSFIASWTSPISSWRALNQCSLRERASSGMPAAASFACAAARVECPEESVRIRREDPEVVADAELARAGETACAMVA